MLNLLFKKNESQCVKNIKLHCDRQMNFMVRRSNSDSCE